MGLKVLSVCAVATLAVSCTGKGEKQQKGSERVTKLDVAAKPAGLTKCSAKKLELLSPEPSSVPLVARAIVPLQGITVAGAVAFTPDGKLAVSTHDSGVFVWNWRQPAKLFGYWRTPIKLGFARIVRRKAMMGNTVYDGRLAISADSKRVLTVRDGKGEIWTLADGVSRVRFDVPRSFTPVQTDPQLSWIGIAGRGDTTRIYDLRTGLCRWQIKRGGVAFHPDGKHVYVVYRVPSGVAGNGVYDLKTGASLRSLTTVPWISEPLAITGDGKFLLVGLRSYDTRSGALTASVAKLSSKRSRLLAIHKRTAFSKLKDQVIAWDVTTGKVVETLDKQVRGLAVHPTEPLRFVQSLDRIRHTKFEIGYAYGWIVSATERKRIRPTQIHKIGGVLDLAFTKRGELRLVGGDRFDTWPLRGKPTTANADLFAPKSRRALRELAAYDGPWIHRGVGKLLPKDWKDTIGYAGRAEALIFGFNPTPQLIAIAVKDKVTVISPKGNAKTFKAGAKVRALGFTRDGKKLVVGVENKKIEVWSIAEAKRISEIVLPSLAFSVAAGSDGTTVSVGTITGEVLVVDTVGRKVLRTCRGDLTTRIAALIHSPNDALIAGQSASGTIVLWEHATCKPLARLAGIINDRFLASSPDGGFDGAGKALDWVTIVQGVTIVKDPKERKKLRRPGLIGKILRRASKPTK